MAGGEGQGHGHGTRAIIAAFFANLGIALAKFVGYVITGSSSMLAEAIHSVADTGNQALLLLGGRRARKEATPLHPFGFGRERYFWSFVVALVLFTLGSAFAIYEGVHKLQHPEPLESPGVAYAILGVAIVLESFSLRTAIVESRLVKGSNSWPQFIRRAKTPELPVVLLEDLGALAGLFIAFTAISIAELTDEPKWDGVGTIIIGVLLGIIATVLAIEMKGLLIGEAADVEVQRKIQRAIESDRDVQRLIHFRTEHIGPDEILVAGKIEFSVELSVRELADVVNRIEGAIRAEVPTAHPIYLEPDVSRDAAPDAQTPAPGGGAGVTP
jgi:cation diffusion facilitator family transporter